MTRFAIARFDEIAPVECPCGLARRAFATPDNSVATVHQVEIRAEARVHYHKTMTEIYVVLEGEGSMELDGSVFPVKPHDFHPDQAGLPPPRGGRSQDSEHCHSRVRSRG